MLLLRRHLPPGPFPLPLFGNHFQTPSIRPWITWQKWSQYYDNPLTTLWIGRHPRIIVQDAWTASELMEKKSELLSSRPRLVVMGDLIGTTKTNQTTLEYGDRWRVHRKLMHTVVGTQAVRNYHTFQADESKLLTRDLLLEPSDYVMSIERYSISITSIIGWGRRIAQKNDYVAQQALALMDGVNFVIPGLYILEALPWLAHLPSWIYALPSQLRETSKILFRYFYLLSLESAQSSSPSSNFAKTLVKSQQGQGLSDVEVAGLTANLIGGGVDTTSSTMISCILALCSFPDVQAKAHAELDAVIGRERSPTWDDVETSLSSPTGTRTKLPYLAALVKETLRWRTVTVLAGIPHANTKPFTYRGYRFAARTNFTGNMWAIHRHEREFPRPDEFRPERFLEGKGGDEDGKWKRPYPNKNGMNAFGWGRRVCSGQPLAEQGLLYSLTRLIWAFEVRPGLDEMGNEIPLDIFAYTESENTRPMPFKARFIPRSESIRKIILEEADVAREELRVYDGETKLTMADAVA
ncbi:cytochrome P450 [Cadophora sp. DSE1049]|nr:cytochrome P450 [Cadophora sp. DSE1049]